MNLARRVQFAILLPVVMLALSVSLASAQIPNTPNLPTDPRGKNGATSEQLQKLAWLRYLQGRSGGGVQRGVPQFVPFGGQMPIGNMPNQGSSDPDADADQGKKSVAEKKADYEAAREEKKLKAKQRAEKRKAELAERRAKAAAAKQAP